MNSVLLTRTRRVSMCLATAAVTLVGTASMPSASMASASVVSRWTASGSAVSVPETAPAAKPAASAIKWNSCTDGFQCATVQVPLDYDRPGATISLALIRLPATDQKHRKGSLFLNPGGPGISGVGAVRAGKSYPPAIRRQFDLVGMDPRGIAASTPLRCFDNDQQANAAQHRSAFPVTATDIRQWKTVDQLLAADCAANAGLITDHMSTGNVARDLDRLRGFVGDARLNFLGFSYGSILGQTYANMFPQNVGALIIDGVLDPVAWWQGCAFAGRSRARFDALAAKLRIKPVEYPGAPGLFIDYPALMKLASNSMYRPSSWPGLAEDLADLEAAAGASPATVSPGTPDQPQPADPANEYAQFEGFDGVICSDTDNPVGLGQWTTASQQATARFPHFGAL